MSTTRGDEPAYPTDDFVEHPSAPAGGYMARRGGLSKRELFAAMAMQGLLAGGYHDRFPGEASEQAVLYADSLLAELERGR